MTIAELQARLAEINDASQAVLATAEADKRDLSAEEEVQLQQLLDEFDRNKARLEQLQRFEGQAEQLKAGTGRKTLPDVPGRKPSPEPEDDGEESLAPSKPPRMLGVGNNRVPAEPIRDRKGGFRSLGDMAYHCVLASQYLKAGAIGQVDSRLQRLASASTYGNEGSGADGGFAVPPDFRADIMQKVMGEASLLPDCDQITVSGNSFTCPKDETTPWQTSGGIQATWDGEAVAATQSKPQLEEVTVKLNKIRALVPMSEELLSDASAMDAYLRRKAPDKIAFKVSRAIIAGTGVGQPLGILTSPALVSVAKESSQVADTLVGNNVIKMYSRMPAANRSNAKWYINQDIEPQLYKLALPGTDNTGNAVTGWGGLVYMPAGGLSGSPFGTLFGRPVVPTQACNTLGDQGDIIFADLSQYMALLKSGPNPRVETSIHLWFDQDLTAFKFILRVGGQPWWSSSISALNGSATYSPFVTLDERA